MRRRAALLLLVSLSILSLLAGCSPTSASPAAQAPAATPSRTETPVVSPRPSATHTPSPSPSPTRTPAPSAAPSLTPPPSPSPLPDTPTPTVPPLLAPVPGEPHPLSLGWRLDANGHLASGLVMETGDRPLFLLASLGRTVYALTGEGQVAWKLRTTGPAYALAGLEGTRAAVGDDSGGVTAFSADGEVLWQVSLGSRITALHGGWQHGLLAGGWDERLSFLEADGELRWQAYVDGPVSGIASLPDLAVVSTLKGEVAAFDGTGAEMWRLQLGAPVTSIGATGEGAAARVLVALQDGQLVALSPEGAQRWQLPLDTGGPSAPGGPVWHAADLSGDTGAEIVAGIGGTEPLLALISGNGEILWQRVLPSAPNTLVSLDLDGDGSREILAGLASGEVQAYDVEGRLRGSLHAGLQVWGLHVAAEGTTLIRADVVAWRLRGQEGPTGQSWLQPPATLPLGHDPFAGAPERQEGETILVFLGDVAPGRSMEAQLARYGPSYPWEGIAPLLEEADVVTANLEGLLATRGSPMAKSYLIRAHPDAGKTLVAAGFDLVHLGNNHALDYGQAALDQTLSTLEYFGIGWTGTGSSREMAHAPEILDLNGLRVAVLGYAAARWNGSEDVPATDRIAWAEPGAIQVDVQAVREQADLVVVQLHAGTEYATSPSPDQVRVAHAAIDAGADLVVGHHPHVTQTVERYKEGLIVYSLGDALFDIPRQAAMQGHLLRIHATQDGLVQAELWPFWIADTIQLRLLDDGEGKARYRIIYP